jgi:hypothetical protein
MSKSPLFIVLLLVGPVLASSIAIQAQNANPVAEKPAASAAAPVYKSDLGFAYGYSPEWELIDTKPLTPIAQQKAAEGAKSDEEKKGAACAQIGLMLKHGDPASIIMTVSLPYECYGSAFTDADLPGFGTGVSSGLKQNFTVGESKTATYKLGSHNLWVERALSTAKADPAQKYTIETVCAMLKKAATCWIGMVKDDAALKVMEQSQVTLESDAPTALVPADALAAAKP